MDEDEEPRLPRLQGAQIDCKVCKCRGAWRLGTGGGISWSRLCRRSVLNLMLNYGRERVATRLYAERRTMSGLTEDALLRSTGWPVMAMLDKADHFNQPQNNNLSCERQHVIIISRLGNGVGQ